MKIRFYLTAFLLFFYCSVTVNAEVYEVSTAADFKTHLKANHNIKLIADIDLGSCDFETIDEYTGEISGVKFQGDYEYTGNETEAELEAYMSYYVISNVPQMFAKKMTGAYIHDVMFKDCSPEWDNSPIDNRYGTSLLARDASNCRFENIVLHNINLNGHGFQGSSSDGACLVCSDNGSTFKKISAYASKVYNDHCYTAIFAAHADGSTFTDCSSSYGCAVYADGGGINSYCGGIVGEATNVKFLRCINNALVAGNDDCVGGIAGKSNSTDFDQCLNFGPVTHAQYGDFNTLKAVSDAMYSTLPTDLSSDEVDKINARNGTALHPDAALAMAVHGLNAASSQAALILARNNTRNYLNAMFASDEFNASAFKAPANANINTYNVWTYATMAVAVVTTAIQIAQMIYEAQDDDNVGGIVGLMNGGTALRCTNLGRVYSADAYCGGIVGEANGTPTIKECLNNGLVQGYEQTGGIVGRIENGTIKSCLNVGNVSNGNSGKDTFGKIYGQKDSGVTSKGNLYSGKQDQSGTPDCREISLKTLASGEAAIYLNQYADSAVWRQTIGIDYYPDLCVYSEKITADKIQPNIDPTVRTKNASTFIKALANQYSDIVLTGDIDLNTSMFNFSSSFMPFYGTIDGQNHRLKNVSYILPAWTDKLGNNDNSNKNVGLLSYAKNATFRNLELNDFRINNSIAYGENCGLLVGNSANCTYDNIRITGTSGLGISSPTYAMCNIGCLIGTSSNDKISNCMTGPFCSVISSVFKFYESVYAGGLVGKASGTEMSNCYNQASVTASDDYAGGIVGYLNGGKIASCLNMATIIGEEEVGGIAGEADDADILGCVNTGLVKGNASTVQDGEIGGIVGVYKKANATGKALKYCCNWGDVDNVWTNDDYNAIWGETSGDPTVSDNYWSFNCEGVKKTNLLSGTTVDDILTGKFAYTWNVANTAYPLYQNLDQNTFPTHYPGPIALAGLVYKDFLCNGNVSYSNKYGNTTSGTHTPDLDKFGICKVCGAIRTITANVTIDNASEMLQFAYASNKGQDFTQYEVNLNSDIDMKALTYIPVGTAEHPYQGTFNGNGHRIKNIYLEKSDGNTGIFGRVTGTTRINDLIADSTCVFKASVIGVAGIVGCVESESGSSCSLAILRCGNEAVVTGTKNVAGILGGVYTNDNAYVNIFNCYNTGRIKGDEESAAICGYGRKHAYVERCWNAGLITGYKTGASFSNNETGGDSYLTYCYNSSDNEAQTGITSFDLADVTTGKLCYIMNECTDGLQSNGASKKGWYQKIGTDVHPVAQMGADNAVYHHDFHWCNEPTVTTTLYNNSSDAIAAVQHEYAADGLCRRVAGELHGEQPDKESDYWQITKLGHLYWLAENVNSGTLTESNQKCKLVNDITDNQGVLVNRKPATDPELLSVFHKWTPIGTTEHPFKGYFDGWSHTISGIYCYLPGKSDIGLFGVVDGNSIIDRFKIQDSYFSGDTYVGAFAGLVKKSSSFANCYSDCYLYADYKVGGIVGAIETDEMTYSGNYFENCYSASNIVCDLYNSNKDKSGSIVGYISKTDGTKRDDVTLERCCYMVSRNSGEATNGIALSDNAIHLGQACRILNTRQVTSWAQKIGSEAEPYLDMNRTGLTYDLTAKNEWGSIVMPFTLVSNDDITYYTVDNVDTQNQLHVTSVQSVEPNTPCFYHVSEANTTVVLKDSEEDCIVPDMTDNTVTKVITSTLSAIGTYEQKTVEPATGVNNYYIAQNKLWLGTKAFALPAYRSYLQNISSSPAKSLSIFADDYTTAIGEVSADGTVNFYDDKCYNLSGQRVYDNAKGIIIKNGKKIIVR